MVAATADGHRVCVEGTHGAHAATLAQQDGLSQEQLQATTDIDVAAHTAWPPRDAHDFIRTGMPGEPSDRYEL